VRRPEEEWWSKASVPPIIDQDTLLRAEAQLTANRRSKAARPTRVYLLRSLLRCKQPVRGTGEPCDRILVAHTRQYHGCGREHSYYDCNRRYYDAQPGERRTCCTHLPGTATDERVWRNVVAAIQDSAQLHAAFDRLTRQPQRARQQWQEAIQRLAAEKEHLEKLLREQQRLLEQGTYSEREYRLAKGDVLPRLEEVEASLEQAQHELAHTREVRIDVAQIERCCAEIAHRAEAATPEQRAEILRSLLTSVDVYPDRLVAHGVLGDIVIDNSPAPRHQLGPARTSRSRSAAIARTA
jgi:hypothetical protein